MTLEINTEKLLNENDPHDLPAWIRQLELSLKGTDFSEIGRRSILLDGLRRILDMADDLHRLTDPEDLSRRERLQDWGEDYIEGLHRSDDQRWLEAWLADEIELRTGAAE